MKRIRKTVGLVLVLLAMFAFGITAQAKTGLSKKKLTVKCGKTATIELKGASGGIRWSTSKSKVASIKARGNKVEIFGLKAGKAKITAKVGKKKYVCKVSVKEKPVISAKSATIGIGGKLRLMIAGTGSKVKWSSSKKKVATVKKIGPYLCEVTGKKAGTATIKAKVGKKNLKCKVTVKNGGPAFVGVDPKWEKEHSGSKDGSKSGSNKTTYVNGISVTYPTTLMVKTGMQARYTVSPSNATNKAVSWSSSNSAVATVDETGLIRGVSAGTATITATATDGSGVSGSLIVTITDDVEEIRKGLAEAKKKGPAAFISYYEHLSGDKKSKVYIGRYGLRATSYTVGPGAPINIEKDYGDAVKAIYFPWIKSVHDKSLARFTNDPRAKLFFMANWLHSQYVQGSIKEIQRINGFLLCPSIAKLLAEDAYPAGNCAAATSFMLDAAYYLFGYSGTSVHWDGSPHMGAGVLINGKTYLYDPQFGAYGEMINGKLKDIDDITDDYGDAIDAVRANHTSQEVDYTM